MGNVTDVVFCLQIRFQDDSIDETSEVEAALVGSQTTHSADSGNSSSESPPDKPTPLDVSVLDLAAGTGLLGAEISHFEKCTKISQMLRAVI